MSASEQTWARLQTAQAVAEARAGCDASLRALGALAADADWESKGTRALHDALNDLRDRTAALCIDLARRADEIERLVYA